MDPNFAELHQQLAGGEAPESTAQKASLMSPNDLNNMQEKELETFLASVLAKTSGLHKLSGHLQKDFDDPKATKRLGRSLSVPRAF